MLCPVCVKGRYIGWDMGLFRYIEAYGKGLGGEPMNRLHKNVKRMLTGILAAAMIVTSFPSYALAAEIPADNTANAAVTMDPETGDMLLSEVDPGDETQSNETDEAITDSSEEESSSAVEESTYDSEDESSDVVEETDTSEESDVNDETESVDETDEALTSETVEEEDAKEEDAKEEDAKDPKELLGEEEVVYYTINISDDMENDHYTILPHEGDTAFFKNTELDIWQVEGGARAIGVDITIDDGYELDGEITATVGEKEIGLHFVSMYNCYAISPASGINGDIVITVNVRKEGETPDPNKPIPFVIEYKLGVDTPIVIQNGAYIEAELVEPSDPNAYRFAIYKIVENTTVSVTAAAVNNYKLSEILLDGEPVENALKTGTFNVTVKRSSKLTIKAVGSPIMYVGSTPYADKATVNLPSDFVGVLKVACGEEYCDICSVTAKQGTKAVEGFVKISEADSRSVDIDAAKAASLGTGAIKVTLSGEDFGTKVINFVVAQDIDASKVSIKGFDKKNTVTLKYGSDATYQIVLNKGADFDRLDIDTTNDDYIGITKDAKGNPVLKVSTYDAGPIYKLAPAKMSFILKDKLGGKEISEEYTVNVEAPTLPTPTVKVVSSTDIDMKLSISMPKSVKNRVNMYYVITADAVDTVDPSSPMAESVLEWIPADSKDTVYTLKLTKDKNANLGNGKAQKYNVAVGAFQVMDDSLENGIEEGKKYSDTNKLQNPINYKELKNQSTKDPYYETKLSLKKNKTSFIIGERNILLATAKFSKKTSYTRISWAEIQGGYYNKKWTTDSDYDVIRITDDGQGIEIVYSDYLSPGSYTLRVLPYSESGMSALPAVMNFTVKPSVNVLSINTHPEKIYKAPGKVASIKFSAKIGCVYGNGALKPANSKIEWSLSYVGSKELEKALKINKNNGTVTLAKDYVLSSDPEKNQFMVTARAVDVAENNMSTTSDYVTFTNIKAAPAKIMIGSVVGATGKDKPQEVYSSDLNMKDLSVYDSNNNALYSISDTANMTISVSPKKGMVISGRSVYVTKTGTYTVKATTRDGGKQSISAKFKVVPAPLDESDPYSIVVRSLKNDNIYSEEAIPDNSEISDVAYLYIELQGNTIDGKNSLNAGKPTLSVTGGKRIDYPSESRYITVVKPDQGEIKITVTDKTLKGSNGTYSKTHRIKIKENPSLGSLSIPNNLSIIHDGVILEELELPLSDVEYRTLSGNERYKLIATPYEGDMIKSKTRFNTDQFCEIINSSFRTEVANDASDTAKASQAILTYGDDDMRDIDADTLNCYLTLCIVAEEDYEDVVKSILTKPAKFTLKVKKEPPIKIALNNKVSFPSDAEEVELKFKTKANVSDRDFSCRIYDDIVDGQSNHFTDAFDVEYTESCKLMLRKKDGVILTPGTKISFIIHYWAYGEGAVPRNAVDKYERVTVTIK